MLSNVLTPPSPGALTERELLAQLPSLAAVAHCEVLPLGDGWLQLAELNAQLPALVGLESYRP
jgi:hypothetical protein